MPSNARVFLKPFIGGLNTEGSDTDDLVLNTSDELNCTILPEGMRGRRYGFNIEKDGEWIDAGEEIKTHSLYFWNNVYGDTNFIVVQINKKIKIYPDESPISINAPLFEYDVPEQYYQYKNQPLSMTSVSSSLFVVGEWCVPFVIEYDYTNNEFSIVENNPKFRDIVGVDDGYSVDYLPTMMTSKHLYNLMNQGWDHLIYDPEKDTSKSLLPSGTYNGLFYEQVKKYPANNLQWFVGKEKSGEYNTTDLLNTYFGNTPAPKGHFILDYLHRDRSLVSGIAIEDTKEEEKDGIKVITNRQDYTTGWYGKTGHAAGVTFIMVSKTDENSEIWTKYTTGNNTDIDIPIEASSSTRGVLQRITVQMRDYIAYPSAADVGSGMEAYLYTNAKYREKSYGQLAKYYYPSRPFTFNTYGHTASGSRELVGTYKSTMTGHPDDPYTFSAEVNTAGKSYERYSFEIVFQKNGRDLYCPPTYFDTTIWLDKFNYNPSTDSNYQGLPSTNILSGAITSIESFGGRLFYLCGNTILFSQTLGAGNQNYDKCYQDADPTSEEISDPIMTDGGTIQMLSLGKGKTLKAFYRGVLVFGDQEVSAILSPYNNLFTATEYDIVKITTAGITSPYSVVETDNFLYYWSNHGIFEVGINENNNIYSRCVTNDTIMSYYNNLSQYSKDNCIGYFDYANNRIYWFFPTNGSEIDKLDGCLVLDLNYGCFMPQEIDAGHVVRDYNGRLVGRLDNRRFNIVYNDGKKEPVTIFGNTVYTGEDIVGYTQNAYLADCAETLTVKEIYPTIYLRAGGNKVTAGDYNVVVEQNDREQFKRLSAGVFLVSDDRRYSFGEFNSREFKDWDVSPYDSYMVSRPITLGDTYFNKQTPVMQTLFKRTEEYELKNLADIEETVYTMKPLVQKEGRWYNYVLNKGKFRSITIEMDFTGQSPVPSNVYMDVTVGSWGSGVTGNIASYSGYTALDSSRIVKVTIPVKAEHYDTECNTFNISIRCQQMTQENTTIKANILRTDWNEKQFNGFELRKYSNSLLALEGAGYSDGGAMAYYMGQVPVAKYSILKKADITYKPMIRSLTVVGVTTDWSGYAYVAINKSGDADDYGIKGYVSKDSPTLSADAIDSGMRQATAFGINIRGLKVTGGTFLNMWASVDLEYLEPVFIDVGKVNSERYTTPSGAKIRMRWGWSCNPLSNRWDMVQNGYRPQKDFLHDDYVESRLHIHGRGKAFQIEIRNDDNKDFRLTGMNIITRSPQ